MPAPFRGTLSSEAFNGIVAYQSFINPCIEACAMSRIEALSERIEALDPFSEEHDAFAATILGGSVQLGFDGEGRITVPTDMLSEVEITDEVVFVGKGKTFEIWQPSIFATHAQTSRKIALDKRAMLRSAPTTDKTEQ